MSPAAPRSPALQAMDAAARILLDAAALAAAEHRAANPSPVAEPVDRVAFALQAVLREAHGDGVSDADLFTGLATSVAMFARNQRLTTETDYFLSVFQSAVRAHLPRPTGGSTH